MFAGRPFSAHMYAFALVNFLVELARRVETGSLELGVVVSAKYFYTNMFSNVSSISNPYLALMRHFVV